MTYYLTLLQFLENKKVDEPQISEILKFRRNNIFANNLDTFAIYNPYFKFFSLEQEVVGELRTILKIAFLNSGTAAGRILKETQWNTVIELELSLTENELPLLQTVGNQTLLENYFQANIHQIIERAERLSKASEEEQFLAAYIYGAVVYSINKTNDVERPDLLRLAFDVKNHLKNIAHTQIIFYNF